MGGEIGFKWYEQHQGDLFPAHLSEALDPSDPVFFISDWLDSADLRVFEERYAMLGERVWPFPENLIHFYECPTRPIGRGGRSEEEATQRRADHRPLVRCRGERRWRLRARRSRRS